MKRLILLTVLMANIGVPLFPASAQDETFVYVSLAQIGNWPLDWLSTPLQGEVELGGIPFNIVSGNQAVFAMQGYGSENRPTEGTVTGLSIANPAIVYILPSGGWLTETVSGEKIGEVVFGFEDRTNYTFAIIAGIHIREIWESTSADIIRDVSPSEIWQNVYTGTFSHMPSQAAYLDMLAINIPEEYRHKTLISITLRDTSLELNTSPDPAFHVAGITVQRTLEPMPVADDYELRFSLDTGASDIVEVRVLQPQSNDDGTVTATVVIDSKASIAYGVSFATTVGSINGTQIEFLMTNNDELPILMPQVSQSLGEITFSPNTELRITFSKFGFSPGDGRYLRFLNGLTFLSLLGGPGYVPDNPSAEWYWELAIQGASEALQLLPFGENARSLLTGLLLGLQVNRGDREAQVETLADFLIDNPDIGVELLEQRGIETTEASLVDQIAAVRFADMLIDTEPLLSDFIVGPERGEVRIYTQPVLNPDN